MEEMIYCSELFCPLEKQCARKSYLGKPHDEDRKFKSYRETLVYHKEDDTWCCEDGINKDCN